MLISCGGALRPQRPTWPWEDVNKVSCPRITRVSSADSSVQVIPDPEGTCRCMEHHEPHRHQPGPVDVKVKSHVIRGWFRILRCLKSGSRGRLAPGRNDPESSCLLENMLEALTDRGGEGTGRGRGAVLRRRIIGPPAAKESPPKSLGELARRAAAAKARKKELEEWSDLEGPEDRQPSVELSTVDTSDRDEFDEDPPPNFAYDTDGDGGRRGGALLTSTSSCFHATGVGPQQPRGSSSSTSQESPQSLAESAPMISKIRYCELELDDDLYPVLHKLETVHHQVYNPDFHGRRYLVMTTPAALYGPYAVLHQ